MKKIGLHVDNKISRAHPMYDWKKCIVTFSKPTIISLIKTNTTISIPRTISLELSNDYLVSIKKKIYPTYKTRLSQMAT